MADHRIDVDAVEDPVQLLGRKRDDRLLATRPSELVLGQPLQDQHKTRSVEEQELHPVAPTTDILHTVFDMRRSHIRGIRCSATRCRSRGIAAARP